MDLVELQECEIEVAVARFCIDWSVSSQAGNSEVPGISSIGMFMLKYIHIICILYIFHCPFFSCLSIPFGLDGSIMLWLTPVFQPPPPCLEQKTAIQNSD